ncbi:MAG: M50 family metallopeptidase [Candidatus Limnocylindrales bacterium]
MSLDGVLFWVVAIPLLLLVLIPLVMVHELGHFIMARLAGIRVLEFGLGFPPRAKVIGHDHETEYTLNYLPIGGFVRLEGEETNSDDPRAFTNAPLAKQLIVLVAGVFMNLVTATVLFFIVAWAFNPRVQPTIAGVVANSPAQSAGLQVGDVLISLNGKTYAAPSVLEFTNADNVDQWSTELRAHAGQTIDLVVADSSGKQRNLVVTLRVPTANEGALGVQLGASLVNSPGDPVSAVGMAVGGTGRAMDLIIGALGDIGRQLFTNPSQAPPGVQGPVGIASDVGHAASQPDAVMLFLLLAAVLSANLALVNILPVPVLDGGKMVIMVVKRIFGARGVSAVETFAYVASFALLLAFVGWITYFDIVRGGAP